MNLLQQIHTRADLLALTDDQLIRLCGEIRDFLVNSVSQTGGHLASNLGIVELSVALERVFDTEKDRLLFDVGHQSYVHKLLTGRQEGFARLRSLGGMSGFPKPSESVTDPFVAGHASVSVSTALGMARARTLQKQDYHVVALLGDGAMTGGVVYEAMNDAGQSNEPLIVILNDNGMSIAPNVGGVSEHLTLLRTRPGYFRWKKIYRAVLKKMPGGNAVYRLNHRVKERMKRMLFGVSLFEAMGFEYFGPVDGHDLKKLEYMLGIAKECKGPCLLHVITKKGHGYAPAENNPDVFHGVGKFDPESGKTAPAAPSFSAVFGSTLCALAREDDRVCAVSAAMVPGTGLSGFAAEFPGRCFDVGIAEEHAVSMAGGLAKQGMIPVVAIYSTFLQRAYDMLIQDVSMLKLHVVFAVDRAGLVGEDGETHHGVFDVSYLRTIPHMQILCPANLAELRVMLRRAVLEMDGPVAVRYPRGGDGRLTEAVTDPCLRPGRDITLVSYGTLINQVLEAADLLQKRGVSAEVIKLNSVKPIDMQSITASVRKTRHLLVAEETICTGCVGKEIVAQLQGLGVASKLCNIGDRFVTHGATAALLELMKLDAASLEKSALEVLNIEA